MLNKVIKVNRISLTRFNDLMDMGYTVQIIQSTPNKEPFAQYQYNRPLMVKDKAPKKCRTPIKNSTHSCIVSGPCKICGKNH